MQASRPSEGRAALGAPVPAKCPRCSAPVAGDYKFCPVCAYRLRIDPGDPPPPPPTSPWKRGFLVATGVTAVFACVLVGVVLIYRPEWIQPRPPTTTTLPPAVRAGGYVAPAIGIDDVPKSMRQLKPEEIVRYYEIPKLIPRLPDVLDKLNDAFDPTNRHAETLFPGEEIPFKIDYAMQAGAFEITNHQYAEFVRDLEANPDRLPDYWRKDPVTMKDFSLLRHVPRAWLVADAGGEPTGWRLPDDARNLPVADVSFVDAVGFAQWASARFHLEGAASLRLPVSSEWLRAARGVPVERPAVEMGDERREWPWGTTQLIYACNNSTFWPGVGRAEYVHFEYAEGGHGLTNEGLFAMAGNVAEMAVEEDLELVLGETPEKTYLKWRYKSESPKQVYACGGSFRSGIDDCQVTSTISLGVRERRDDVGFRLFSSAPAPGN